MKQNKNCELKHQLNKFLVTMIHVNANMKNLTYPTELDV